MGSPERDELASGCPQSARMLLMPSEKCDHHGDSDGWLHEVAANGNRRGLCRANRYVCYWYRNKSLQAWEH
jgi:hypothetical protein